MNLNDKIATVQSSLVLHQALIGGTVCSSSVSNDEFLITGPELDVRVSVEVYCLIVSQPFDIRIRVSSRETGQDDCVVNDSRRMKIL